jgi:F0F1-type ATP synthase membrane subunit a
MGRCRFFNSVSVFGFLVGFLKVGSVFGVGFVKNRGVGSVFRFFFQKIIIFMFVMAGQSLQSVTVTVSVRFFGNSSRADGCGKME